MLYCSRCRKKVDFNSTSVQGPTRAYTLDLDGPIDPTIIRSSSKVVNVCKNCGSQNLFQSEAAFQASLRRAAQTESNENLAWKILGVATILAGVFGAIVFGNAAITASSDSDMAHWGVGGSAVVGFLVGSITVGIIGALCIGLSDSN
jgi:hypothetical protein